MRMLKKMCVLEPKKRVVLAAMLTYNFCNCTLPIHKALARSLQAGLHQNLTHLARESYILAQKSCILQEKWPQSYKTLQ